MKRAAFDLIVLTVGNEKQKNLCEKLLSSFDFNCDCPITVLSDDYSGCRLGSGGAFLNVIDKYCGDNKVLLINSGGMSKRCVNYAVRGKVFAQVNRGSRAVTLLEIIIKEAEKIAASFNEGLLVSCSDIPIKSDSVPEQLTDNTGFCIRSDFETGSRHGVMLADEDGKLDSYPHKLSVNELEKAVKSHGESKPLIDTGVTFFNSEFISAAKTMLKEDAFLFRLKDTGSEINLYSDIIYLLSRSADKLLYLNETGLSDAHRELRRTLFKRFARLTMDVCELKNGSFTHFGTVKESIKNIIALSDTVKNDACIINSLIEENSKISVGSVVENSILTAGCKIGRDCLVSDVSLSAVDIPDNTLVCGIKLCDGGFVTIVCKTDENPKTIVNSAELWETPRFYKGRSFSDSYNKLMCGCNKEKLSLKDCIDNADFGFYADNRQYISDYSLSLDNASARYTECRCEIITNYFSSLKPLKSVKCSRDSITVALPVRVNLSGTWSDAMPYCTDNGGGVINMAVTVDDKLPITVTVEKLSEKRIVFRSDNQTTELLPGEINSSDGQNGFSDFNLHRAALQIMGFSPETVIEDGFMLTTSVNTIAKGSGLGTSSILLVGCFRALGLMFSREYNDSEIISMVFAAEQLMKTGGGWQDQIGGILPGIKFSTSSPGTVQQPKAKVLDISDNFRSFINSRLILVSTGRRHFGRFIVIDIMRRYLDKNETSLNAFCSLTELNEEMNEAVISGNESSFSACINRQHELLCELSPRVTNARIEKIRDELGKIADGVCICGAGGGGYLLTVLKAGVTPASAKDFIAGNTVFSGIAEPVKTISLYE